jgi:hypothetical protein
MIDCTRAALSGAAMTEQDFNPHPSASQGAGEPRDAAVRSLALSIAAQRWHASARRATIPWAITRTQPSPVT